MIKEVSTSFSSTGTESRTDKVLGHLSPEDTIVVLNKTDLLSEDSGTGSCPHSELRARLKVEPALVSWL